MKREEFIEKWGASMGHGFTDEELSADLDSLSLPPAEGAKAILLKHCKENKVFLTSNELHTILDAMTEFAAQQQPTADEIPPDPTAEAGCGIYDPTGRKPTAEGAEEILKNRLGNQYSILSPLGIETIIAAMTEFTTLHAQRIAEKMVEKELTNFKSWYNAADPHDHILTRDIDEYLKTRDSHE